MKKYILDGEIYYLKDGIFYDSKFIAVDNRTAEKLIKLWNEDEIKRLDNERGVKTIASVFGVNYKEYQQRYVDKKVEQKPKIKRTQQRSVDSKQLHNNCTNETTKKNLKQYDYIKVPAKIDIPKKVINGEKKAPQLSDYNLTQEDIETYSNQQIKLEKAQQKVDELNKQLIIEQKEAESKCESFAWIAAIIGFFLAIVIGVLNADEISDLGGILLFAFCVILLPYVVYKIAKSQFTILQQNPKRVDRNKYIDEELERNIRKFESDTYNFAREEERKTIEFWDNLTGHQFEWKVAELLRPLCYEVYTTPGSGDGGIDNIMIYNGRKYAIQCKHHIKPCGPGALRELRGIISDGDDYCQGIFISLNGYTPGAIEENNNSKNPIILWDRGKLIQIAKVKDLSIFL